MPRHCAPNHPDCCIDCPNGGFAHYIEPYGPCKRGCSTDQLGDATRDIVTDHGWDVESSGVIRGVTKQQLSDIARDLRPLASGNRDATDALDDLVNIDPAQANQEVHEQWTNKGLIDVIRDLATASGSASSPARI
jgi:hypothetical protein